MSIRTAIILAGATLFGLVWLAAEALSETDSEWVARAPDAAKSRQHPVYREVRDISLARPNAAFEVDGGESGGAEVRGGDGDRVQIHARVEASGETAAQAEELAHQVKIVAHETDLRPEGPEQHGARHWSVIFRMDVPRRMDLKVTAKNGPVSVQDLDGTLELRVQNGPLALTDLAGNVWARVQNGPLAVQLTGNQWHGKRLDAETVNGPVELRLPERYNADLEFGSLTGPQAVRLASQSSARLGSGRRLKEQLGTGGPLVRVVTTNGPAALKSGGHDLE